MSRAEAAAVRRLAKALGVLTEFEDQTGQRQRASVQTLIEVIRCLGEPVQHPRDAPAALRRLEEEAQRRLIEPVIVDWTAAQTTIELRAPDLGRTGAVYCSLDLESGGVRECRSTGPVVALPSDLPVGRHRLTVRAGRREATATILTAPPRVGPTHFIPGAARTLATFLPLYALRTRRDWGVGDLTDLGELARWSHRHGAPIVGTLPLLASSLDRPMDPSPYAPVSRLFYNELYLDITRSPDLELSPAARSMLAERSFVREMEALRRAPEVDYRRVMALKRRILTVLAQAAYAAPRRRRELDRFARDNDLVHSYAAFRAALERRGDTWQTWPQRLRAGTLRRGDYDEASLRYHVYCQALLCDQLRRLATDLRDDGAALYLDLPVGASAGGFDVWRFRSAFATDASVGSPPDPMAPGGQNWGFPPLHPHRSREDGHDYFARCLRAHFAYARLLRIDHVMGLHRIFWIPSTLPASQGAYVRYPADELYAVLSIEAARAGARVVGENLGTVPPEVNTTLARRGVLGMSIAQFEFRPQARVPVADPPADSLAALNTHDLPTFAAFITGADQTLRAQLGLIDQRTAAREQAARRKLFDALVRFARRAGVSEQDEPDELRAALRAVLSHLASSAAEIVLVNLEDLWLETRPQNVPGASDQQAPNWRRRAAHALEEFDGLPGVTSMLRALAELRTRPYTLRADAADRAPGRSAEPRTPSTRRPRERSPSGYTA